MFFHLLCCSLFASAVGAPAAQNQTQKATGTKNQMQHQTGWNKTLLARGRDHLHLVTKFEGVAWPSLAVAESGTAAGETHVFVVGDWGTLLPNHLTAPNVRPRRSTNKCPEHCDYVYGVDDKAQLLVAEQMKSRAAISNPQYVLNPGDNFYWGGITQNCGAGSSSANGKTIGEFAQVWQSVYGPLTNIPWISALGNHDYGGWQFNMGWDQQIAYSHSNPNWVMPARYFSRLMTHPGFTVEVFVIDSNAHNAYPPSEDPEHNICGVKHSGEDATCAAVGGPSSPSDCYTWFWSSYRAQQAWLESKLAASNADWQVVLTHQNCFHDSAWYQKLYHQHGLDLLVTGHRHSQEIHRVGDLPCIVSGGGGGVTSEGPPKGEMSSEYGFFDLAMSKGSIKIELVNFNGKLIDTATITPN